MKWADHPSSAQATEFRAKHMWGSVEAAETQIHHLLKLKLATSSSSFFNKAIESDSLESPVGIYSSAQYDL